MKLLGQPNSINVRKVLWTGAELGLALDREDWGGATRTTSDPDFLRLNPKGLVPVLIDGGLVLSESNAICRYLASKCETSLFSVDPAKRAQIDAWMDWQVSDLNNAWRGVFMGRVRKHPKFADIAVQDESIASWNTAMSLLENHLQRAGPFICGDAFTLADIVLALSTNRWEMTPMERPDLPAVSEWMGRMSDRPGFEQFCRNGVA